MVEPSAADRKRACDGVKAPPGVTGAAEGKARGRAKGGAIWPVGERKEGKELAGGATVGAEERSEASEAETPNREEAARG